MGVIERDPHTGHATTGHEWNGIKELNTAVPWPVWFFLIVSVAFSLVWWILMPAWPLGTTYTKGLLGADVRRDVLTSMRSASDERAVWTQQMEKGDFGTISADPSLMKYVRATGHALFGDNCAACHGVGAVGGPGFPNLTDHAWIWGGTPDAILETIRAGVNSDHPDSRISEMPAWGRDGMLDRAAISDVTRYVHSLSRSGDATDGSTKTLTAGQEVFADNCASCHGENGTGNPDTGGPDLTDDFWLYGGDEASIFKSVFEGRRGQMPAWENRLAETDRAVLMLYILDLRKPSP